LEATLGEIVFSKAGRDRDKKFVVVGIIDEANVLISDGDYRRIEKAKKKKLKHLELTGVTIESIKEKLESRNRITNAELRKALSFHQAELEKIYVDRFLTEK
jgi:large subunit ribosomal protein L14e